VSGNPGLPSTVTKPAPVTAVQRGVEIAAKALADAKFAHRCSDRAFGRASGASKSEVERWCNPRSGRSITVHRLIMAARTRKATVLTFLGILRSALDQDLPAVLGQDSPTWATLLDCAEELAEEARRLKAQDVPPAARAELLRALETSVAVALRVMRELRRD
jgi:transcriptional regulator with XRE-family HTH domain